MKPVVMKSVPLNELEKWTSQGWYFVQAVTTSHVETFFSQNAAGLSQPQGLVVHDTFCLVALDEEASITRLANELEGYVAQVSAHQKVNESMTVLSKKNDQLELQLKSANEIARNAEEARLQHQTKLGHLEKMFEKVTRAIGEKTMKEILGE